MGRPPHAGSLGWHNCFLDSWEESLLGPPRLNSWPWQDSVLLWPRMQTLRSGAAPGRQVPTSWNEWTGFKLALRQKGANSKKTLFSFTPFWKFQGSCSQAACLCLQGSQPPGGFAERPSAPSHERGPAGFLENKGKESPSTTCASWEPPCARARRPLCSHRGRGVTNRWQDSGRRQAEGLGDTTKTKKGGSRYRGNTANGVGWGGGGEERWVGKMAEKMEMRVPKHMKSWACDAPFCTFLLSHSSSRGEGAPAHAVLHAVAGGYEKVGRGETHKCRFSQL